MYSVITVLIFVCCTVQVQTVPLHVEEDSKHLIPKVLFMVDGKSTASEINLKEVENEMKDIMGTEFIFEDPTDGGKNEIITEAENNWDSLTTAGKEATNAAVNIWENSRESEKEDNTKAEPLWEDLTNSERMITKAIVNSTQQSKKDRTKEQLWRTTTSTTSTVVPSSTSTTQPTSSTTTQKTNTALSTLNTTTVSSLLSTQLSITPSTTKATSFDMITASMKDATSLAITTNEAVSPVTITTLRPKSSVPNSRTKKRMSEEDLASVFDVAHPVLLNIVLQEGNPKIVEAVKTYAKPSLLQIALQHSTPDNLRVFMTAFGRNNLIQGSK